MQRKREMKRDRKWTGRWRRMLPEDPVLAEIIDIL